MSEKKSDAKELKPIDSAVLAISEKIQKDLKIDAATGTPVESEKLDTAYVDAAKEHNFDEDFIKRFRHFDELFHAGAAHAVGMKAIPAYVENKELQGVKVPFKLTGRDKMVVSSKRVSTFPNPQNREEPIQTYGDIYVATSLAAGNKNHQLYGNVHSQVRTATAAALKDL